MRKFLVLFIMLLPIALVIINSYMLEVADTYWYVAPNMKLYFGALVIGNIVAGLCLFLSNMKMQYYYFAERKAMIFNLWSIFAILLLLYFFGTGLALRMKLLVVKHGFGQLLFILSNYVGLLVCYRKRKISK